LHINNTLKNREEINKILDEIKALNLSDKQKELLAKFSDLRERFSKEGVNAARGLLKDNKYLEASTLLLTRINPLYVEMAAAGDALISELAADAKREYQEAEVRNQTIRNITIGSLVAAVLIALIGGGLLVAAIVNPIRRAIAHFEQISEGKLTEEIDISGRDETGRLLCNLATMQCSLKAMLDEISTASQAIDSRCNQLENQMTLVAGTTGQCRGRRGGN
jgi:methyl-accepting chemotaxis protein